MPEDYSKETIIAHDDAGAIIKLGEKVQLEGNMLVGESDVCLINGETINRLP